jgi:hypothetical protein
MPRFRNPEDQRIYCALRDQCRAAGISRENFEAGCNWYEQHGIRPMTPEQRAESFTEWMTQRGFGEAVPAIMGVYDRVGTYGAPQPSAADDAETIRLAQERMRSDPDAYFRGDDYLAERYGEALLRAEQGQAPEVSAQLAPKPSPSMSRRSEIERVMKEDNRAYWNSDMPAEYRAILSQQVADAESPGAMPVDTGPAEPATGTPEGWS